MIISQIRLKSNFTTTLFENFLKSNSVLNYHLVNVPIFLPFLLFLRTQFCSKLQCLKRFNLRPGRLYPNILSYICKLLPDTIIVDIRRRRCGNRCTLDVSERLRRSIIVSRSSSIRLLVGNSNDPESGTGRVTYMLAERIPRNVWVITKPPSISLSLFLSPYLPVSLCLSFVSCVARVGANIYWRRLPWFPLCWKSPLSPLCHRDYPIHFHAATPTECRFSFRHSLFSTAGNLIPFTCREYRYTAGNERVDAFSPTGTRSSPFLLHPLFILPHETSRKKKWTTFFLRFSFSYFFFFSWQPVDNLSVAWTRFVWYSIEAWGVLDYLAIRGFHWPFW